MIKYEEITDPIDQTLVGYELVTWDKGQKEEHTEWRFNGKPHREDGPAIIEPDGKKYWSLKGKKLNKAWFLENIDKIVPMQAWELFEPEELVGLKNEIYKK